MDHFRTGRRAAFAAVRAILVLGVSLLCIIHASAQPQGPAPTLDVLPNGLRVIVVERHSAPLVAVDLRVRAGTAMETAENNGIAHFIEHLLFKGTTTRKSGQVDIEIESVGGELNANTSKDWAQFSTVVPKTRWRTAIEILADVAQNPTFRQEDIDNERKVILDELATAQNDPGRAPFHALAAVAYPSDHPYSRAMYGPEASIRNFQREHVVAFWEARFQPRNMSLVIVGDIRRAEAVAAAQELFKAPAATEAAPDSPIPDPGPIKGIVRAEPLIRDRSLVTVVVGFRAPSVKQAEDAVAMDVLLQILAVNGRGRLVDALVNERELAVSVSADYLTQRGPGLVTLAATGRGNGADTARRIEEALLAQVNRLRTEGVTEDEVRSAARALLGQILFDEETFSGEANTLAFYDAIDSYDFAVQYRRRIMAVKPEDIQRVVRTYLNPENYAVATVGPSALPPTPPAAPNRSVEVTKW